jgi:hypothetical protein
MARRTRQTATTVRLGVALRMSGPETRVRCPLSVSRLLEIATHIVPRHRGHTSSQCPCPEGLPMDGFRVDSLTRTLGTAGSRRRALGRRYAVVGSRFDDLVKRLAGSPSRRVVLSAPLAASLAAVVVERPTPTFARKKRRGKKKRKRSPGNGPEAPGCTRNCADKDCGPDGCGGDCGPCAPGETCSATGRCICVPTCGGSVCGDNGCGGSCGTCVPGESCEGGACVCTQAGARGPGELCDVDSQCCPYPGVPRFCTRGTGTTCIALKACRYGHGGPCAGDCDCQGELECQNGACRCPSGRVPHPDGGCCPSGRTPCGDTCCGLGGCICFPGLSCRCQGIF